MPYFEASSSKSSCLPAPFKLYSLLNVISHMNFFQHLALDLCKSKEHISRLWKNVGLLCMTLSPLLGYFVGYNTQFSQGFHSVFHVYSCRYSIDRSSDPGRFFYVDITSGALMTARPLDREDISWHNITVLAMELSKENADCT